MTENALATLLGVPAGELKIPPDRLQERVRVPAVPAGLPLDLPGVSFRTTLRKQH